MKVTLKSGAVAIADDDTEPSLLKHEPYLWDQIATGHVVAFIEGQNGTFLWPLDHLILAPPPSHIVKHRNFNPLDCRRENLYIVEYKPPRGTKRGLNANNNSGYRGIQHIPQYCPNRPWRSQISAGNRCHHLGQFVTLEEALMYRRVAELCCFGGYCQ